MNITTTTEKKVQAVVMEITPEMAQSLIDIGSPNRRLRGNHVERLAADMKAVRWDLNGETVVLAPNGEVLDGSHRLHACVLAGVPFKTVFVQNAKTTGFVTMDSGLTRSLADKLYLRGVNNSVIIAGALKVVLSYDRGSRALGGTSGGPRGEATHRECLAFHKRTSARAWQDAATVGVMLKKIVPRTIATSAHYLFQRVSIDKADDFFVRLNSGANLHEDDAILRLRNKLLLNKISDKKMTYNMVLALVFKTWNHWLVGRKVKRIGIYADEAYPTINGLNSED